MASGFTCKECKYFWRSRKDSRPAYCPRCHSRLIVYDTMGAVILPLVIGLVGLGFFVWSRFDATDFSYVLGMIGLLLAVPCLLASVMIAIGESARNKRELRRISEITNK